MNSTKIIKFKSRQQRDIEEILTEIQRLEASNQFSSEIADLVDFVNTLKTLKVYDDSRCQHLFYRTNTSTKASET